MNPTNKLQNIIAPGTVIKTKHKNSNDWVFTIVLSAYENLIEIKHVEDYLVSVLMIGDILDCKIAGENTFHKITAEVFNIRFVSHTIVLKITNFESIQYSRKHKRYDTYLCGNYSIKGEYCDNYCVVLNVSLGGFYIVTRGRLKTGDVIELMLYHQKTNYLLTECVVQWVDEKEQNHYYGLSIVNVHERSMQPFRHFLRSLQRKETMLYKKLKSQYGDYDPVQ